MANGQAKKLNVALHLDPATSHADAAALDALQDWFSKAKQDSGSQADMDAAIRTLHHDVYLAGLHLYLINQKFCREFASTLDHQAPSCSALQQQLETHGLLSAPEPSPAPTHEVAFSEAQLQQLAQIVSDAPAATAPSPHADETLVAGQLTSQGEQLKKMSEELRALRTLAEQQYAELQRLKVDSPVVSVSAASKPPGTEEMDVAGMEPQIAQMRKIRDKGVF